MYIISTILYKIIKLHLEKVKWENSTMNFDVTDFSYLIPQTIIFSSRHLTLTARPANK